MKPLFVFPLVFSALLSAECAAGAFSVTPVRLYFEPRDRAVAITLVNEGDKEIALQADINSWVQDGAGVDKLELTEDLIVAPPSLKLAPNSKQVIRLALLVPRDVSRQLTYRLVVREIPEALASKVAGVELPIALVLNMPVFVTPAGAKRQLQCVLEPRAATALATAPGVSCENKGNAYAQLRSAELKRAGNTVARFEGGMYLLPGSKKIVPLKAEEAAAPVPSPAVIWESGPAELTVLFDDQKSQTFSVTLP